jgi:hypothetical protein
MALACSCRKTPVMAGAQAQTYALRYLRELSAGSDGPRLLRCRVSGAFWELDDDAGESSFSRQVRLRRIRSAAAIGDWRLYESDDRD